LVLRHQLQPLLVLLEQEQEPLLLLEQVLAVVLEPLLLLEQVLAVVLVQDELLHLVHLHRMDDKSLQSVPDHKVVHQH
jgi:hypothetical protein